MNELSLGDTIQLFTESQTVIDALKNLFQTLGVFALVFVLIAGFLFFLPTILACVRSTSLRGVICAINLLSVAGFFITPILPAIVWLVLMILSIVGKKRISQQKMPDITIYTSSSREK